MENGRLDLGGPRVTLECDSQKDKNLTCAHTLLVGM